MITKSFGRLPSGEQATLYTISGGRLTATVTDYGAHLVSLLVPNKAGQLDDVVLGFDDANGYRTGNGAFLGATVGRNANRIAGASFIMGDTRIRLTPNENGNNLHSGPQHFHLRMWKLIRHQENSVTLELVSPQGDQGFPGKVTIWVTYLLDNQDGLHIIYEADSDRDTIFNPTNHSYFNLAGHDHPERAMDQLLCIPGRFFCPDDPDNIPTGELRPVDGTPFDFRIPKAVGRDIHADYEPLHLQNGYDHNFEVFCNPCAYLSDPESGRTMAVYTDCPGIQLYAGNFLNEQGKGGTAYGMRGGVALETQFFPDAVHHPEWKQPLLQKGRHYRSETIYRFE